MRPGNVLPIEESALLHSIAYVLAPRLDQKLSHAVHSYRLHKEWKKRVQNGRSLFQEADDDLPFLKGATIRKLDPLESWYQAWPEFDRARLALVRKRGFSHLTVTDITCYFENIDLGLLDSILRTLLPREPLLLSLLTRILHSWTRSTSTGTPVGRGIPQGNEVSSFLGNIYLIPLDRALDRFCAKQSAIWIRYVDDVEVYSRDADTAREAIPVINDALRTLHLNLQGSKTDILTGERLQQALFSPAFETVNETCKKLQKLDKSDKAGTQVATRLLGDIQKLASPYRRGLPDSVYRLDKKRSRIFRRILTAYGSVGRAYMKRSALAALTEPPDLGTLLKCVRYLEQLPPRHHDELVDALLATLYNTPALTPYHVAAILGCLRSLHPSVAKLNIVWEITNLGFRQRADWIVRQKTLELLSVLPARESTALKRASNSLEHHHPYVRRAAMLMLARASAPDVRKMLPVLISDPDPPVARLAIHWQRHLLYKSVAQQALANLARRPATDQQFLYGLHWLYILRCHEDRATVSAVWATAERHARSASAKVQWHLRQIHAATAWARRR